MAGVETNIAGVNFTPALVHPPTDTLAKTAVEPEPSNDVPALTAAMARGSEAAFHEFHRRYFDRLLRYLLVVAGGREDTAREALQLTFVRVARHVRRFDAEPGFWNWLTVLARSSFVDETRKQTRYQGLLARFFQQQPADADVKSRDADEHFLKLLQTEMALLPDDERALLEQKYFEGEAVRDLAGERQLTEKALESRLGRIRRKLKTAVLDRLRHETTD
jgi:RNA polymerase sigma factor (sigma-70 family)